MTYSEQPLDFRILKKKTFHCLPLLRSLMVFLLLSLSHAFSIDFSSPAYLLPITLSQPEPLLDRHPPTLYLRSPSPLSSICWSPSVYLYIQHDIRPPTTSPLCQIQHGESSVTVARCAPFKTKNNDVPLCTCVMHCVSLLLYTSSLFRSLCVPVCLSSIPRSTFRSNGWQCRAGVRVSHCPHTPVSLIASLWW